VRLADIAVYVIHAPRLVERRVRLEETLAANGLAAQWVEGPDGATLDGALVRRYYRGRPSLWWRRSRATEAIPFRRLEPREIAVTIAHIQTLDRIAAAADEWALVLEDDAILDPDFATRFDDCFAELPGDADLVYIGSCSGLRIRDLEPGRHFYRKAHPATKCSDSTLVRRRAAAAIAATIVPFTLTIDWELNYQLRRHDLVVYWLEPPLVSQGSETGAYPSSQR
jgi:GR25 family glycosyltransferase involved in LPS biosynthesis